MIGKRIVFQFVSLTGKEVFPQGNDAIVWPLNSKGSFSVKSFYSTQVSTTPTKVCFFAWAGSKGKIPMNDKLKRKNFSGPSRCFAFRGRICGSSPFALSMGFFALGFISL